MSFPNNKEENTINLLYELTPENVPRELLPLINSYLIPLEYYKELIERTTGFPKKYITSDMLRILIPQIDKLIEMNAEIFIKYAGIQLPSREEKNIDIEEDPETGEVITTQVVELNEFWISVDNIIEKLRKNILVYSTFTHKVELILLLDTYEENKNNQEYLKQILSLVNHVQDWTISNKIVLDYSQKIEEFYNENKNNIKFINKFRKDNNISHEDFLGVGSNFLRIDFETELDVGRKIFLYTDISSLEFVMMAHPFGTDYDVVNIIEKILNIKFVV